MAPSPFARGRSVLDEGVPAPELRLSWTLLVAGCAIAAWLTPWLIPTAPWLGPRPWYAGGRTALSMALGAVLLIPGVLLALASVRTLGRPSGLVSTGPFRWTRHPYFLAVLMLLLGLIVALRSVPALVLFVPAVRLTLERARREEHNLVLRLGDEYRAYQARVPFLLPLAPPLPPGGMAAKDEGEIALHLDDDEKPEA